MQTLDVAENRLEGSLPDHPGSTLPNLKSLSMSYDAFTGELLESISNASNLPVIEIVSNRFSGQIPSFGNMRGLKRFNIVDNRFGSGGANNLNILCSLTNSTALEELGIESNNFGGTIPECIGNLSVTLAEFSLSYSSISGSLPVGIGNLANLQILQIGATKCQVPFLLNWETLKGLGFLNLGEDEFSGQIPQSLGNLTMLTKLFLANNDLHGPIPSSLSECQNLLLLYLSDNSLNGAIPSGTSGLASLSLYADFSNNDLTGELPVEVGKLINLGELYVQGNRLSGNIPSSLGSCEKLERLFMGENLFEGSIPPSLSSLKGILLMNLFHYRLSGRIPEFLADLPLVRLDLSSNDLKGVLPTKGVFADARAISVVGNEKLCGDLTQLS